MVYQEVMKQLFYQNYIERIRIYVTEKQTKRRKSDCMAFFTGRRQKALFCYEYSIGIFECHKWNYALLCGGEDSQQSGMWRKRF